MNKGEREHRPAVKSSSAKVIEVVEVKTCIGNGSKERPYRNVTEYWSLDGKFLAVRDVAGFADLRL